MLVDIIVIVAIAAALVSPLAILDWIA